jgi:nitroreductase
MAKRGTPEACALAVARLEWVAAAAGLGTCFAGELVQAALVDTSIATALSVPHGHTVFGAVLLGFPAVSASRPETPPDTTILWL